MKKILYAIFIRIFLVIGIFVIGLACVFIQIINLIFKLKTDKEFKSYYIQLLNGMVKSILSKDK